MANSFITYVSDGSTDTFAFAFDYLLAEHVKVYVNGVEDTTRTLPTASSITLTVFPTSGDVILIKRVTPRDALTVVIPNSGTFRGRDINNQSKQALYVAEEGFDALSSSLSKSIVTDQWDALSFRITNVADPTGAQDATTKAYVDSTTATSAAAAAASAAAASASAGSASASASAAALSYDLFDDRMLGSKAADPTLDNDGDPLQVGALYWNSTSNALKVYNGSAWVSYNPVIMPTVGELSDVTLTGISAGQMLKWNGSAWVNVALPNVGELTDVTLTSIGSGEVLKWNGTAWINNTLAEAGIEAAGATLGQHTIWVPAGATISATTNGAADGQIETTTNKVNIATKDFDASTEEIVWVAWQMPKGWDGGTVVCQAVWSHAATATNFGVVWGVSGRAYADDDALDQAMGTEVTMTDTGGTTNDEYTTPESSAMTFAGSPAGEQWVVFRIARKPANGSDTMAIDARLHGLKIHITTNAANDS